MKKSLCEPLLFVFSTIQGKTMAKPYSSTGKKLCITSHILQPQTDFCFKDFHFQIAQVDYQGQTRYTRILDCNPFISTCYSIGQRLELKFFSSQKFCSMFIKQLLYLRKVRTVNMKFGTYHDFQTLHFTCYQFGSGLWFLLIYNYLEFTPEIVFKLLYSSI